MLAALGAGGLGFALFGPKSAGDPPAGRVVIDYWEKWTGQEALAMQRIIDRFNASQDRIWVRFFSMSAIEQKAMISIAGNDPPDLLGLFDFSLPAFVGSRALITIDELDDAYGAEVSRAFADRYGVQDFRIRREAYTEPAWGLMHEPAGGREVMGGVLNSCSTMALYYSRKAFAEVGLDPDAPPRTIEEFDRAAERLTARAPDGSIERSGFLHREPGWWNWIWGYHFGGSLYNRSSEQATADSPENIAAYRWLQSYPETYGSQRLVAFQSGFGGYNSTQQALLSGKVAMTLHGPFLVNVIKTFQPDFDYAAAPFPMSESSYDPEHPAALFEGDVLCVPRGCPNPREAFEFIMFPQLPENIEELSIAHAKPCPLARPSAGFAARHPNRYVEMHNALTRSPRAFPKPRTRAWPQYEQEFNAEIGTLWSLAEPADRVLERINNRAQSAINRTVNQREQRYGAQG